MQQNGEQSEFAIVALAGTHGTDGVLIGVRFTYRGRDIDARLDRQRREWRVRGGGRELGRAEMADGESAHTVAQVIIGTLLGG